MTTISRIKPGPVLKRDELSGQILELLKVNKDGLTARQVAISTGDPTTGHVLTLLQKSGKIKKKKGFDEAHRIVTVYVINRSRL